MKIFRDPAQVKALNRPVVALSDFDGVHLGHRALLAATVEWARKVSGTPLACIFDPNLAPTPAVRPAPCLITTLHDRLKLLATSGLSGVILFEPTSALTELSQERLISEYMSARAGAFGVVVEAHAHLAFEQPGETDALVKRRHLCGLPVEIVPAVRVGGIQVNSAAIRDLIAAGDLMGATKLLDRYYFLTGTVISGHRRGREIGFPSANLRCDRQCLPPDGVYASWTYVKGARFGSITNIGGRPTFGELERAIETHIFNFSRDIYNERIRVELIERIRGQQKFDSAEALAHHIAEDIKRVREVLAQS